MQWVMVSYNFFIRKWMLLNQRLIILDRYIINWYDRYIINKICPSKFLNFLISMSYNHSRNLKEFKISDLIPIRWSTMEWTSLQFWLSVKLQNKELQIKIDKKIMCTSTITIKLKCFHASMIKNFLCLTY